MNVREFNYLFNRDWEKAGGLITPSTAAKLLGLTTGRMSQICKERQLRKYVYNDPTKPLLSLDDIKKIQAEKYNSLSPHTKQIVDKIEEKWRTTEGKKLEEEICKIEVKFNSKEDKDSYDHRIVEKELEEYEEYMEKEISKK